LGAEALNAESLLLGDLERQRARIGLDSAVPSLRLPSAPVLLVGAQLSAAFRPFARDLSTQLGPPGASDEELERAAETLLLTRSELMEERMAVEAGIGIVTAPEGFLTLDGPQLPKEGLAAILRHRWLRPRAPQMVALPRVPNTGVLRMEALQLVLVCHGAAPDVPIRGLRCQTTERVLNLHGGGELLTIDRDREEDAALWQGVEDLMGNAAPRILVARHRDTLLQGLLDWMNNAG
tara:strand:- start:43 stop:750 length:708 start_codon:yes stop_codon:yes gene_type:complete